MPWLRWTGILLGMLLVWLIWLAPATPLLARIDGLSVAGSPLDIGAVQGTVWDGQAQWRWQQVGGSFAWQLSWREWRPGVQLELLGDARLAGWFGPASGGVLMRGAEASLPLALLGRVVPELSADGWIEVKNLSADLSQEQPALRSGSAQYGGGQVSWAPGESAVIPPLSAVIEYQDPLSQLWVHDPQGVKLALAELTDEMATLRVFRAWPALLGLSQGGNPDDVVFETSRPLHQGG